MTQTIQFEGQTHEFPDDFTDSEISHVLAPQAPALESKAPPSKTDRFLQGVRDPIDAGAQMLVHALPDKLVSGANSLFGDKLAPTAPQLDKSIADRNTSYTASRGANPGMDWMRLAGNVAGTAPLMVAAPASTGLFGDLATGAGTGLLNPVTDTTKDFATEKGKQAGIGAATNAVLGPIARGASWLLDPKPSANVALLQSKGVSPTIGQMGGGAGNKIEQKLTSWVPGAGDMVGAARGRAVEDFNRAVYNEALKPIGETYSGTAGRDGVKAVGDKLSAAYEDLLPTLNFKTDQIFDQQFAGLTTLVDSKYTPDAVKSKVTPILDEIKDKYLAPNGIMDGQAFKELESKLTGEMSSFRKSAEPDNQKAADVIATALKTVRDALGRSNPDAADKLSSLNKGWSVLAKIEKAASSPAAPNGVFSPAQFMQAVKWADNSVRDRATARGTSSLIDLADAGKNVLGNNVPDSGTAGRLFTGGLMTGLLTGEGSQLLHTAAEHPVAAGASLLGMGAASVPYTPWGQKLFSAIGSERSGQVLPALATGVKRAALPAQSAAVYGLLGP